MQAIKSAFQELQVSGDNIERIQIVKSLDILKKDITKITSLNSASFHTKSVNILFIRGSFQSFIFLHQMFFVNRRPGFPHFS